MEILLYANISPNGEPNTKKCVTSKSKRSSYVLAELINGGMSILEKVGGVRKGDAQNSMPLELDTVLPFRLSAKLLLIVVEVVFTSLFLVVSLIFIEGYSFRLTFGEAPVECGAGI